MFLEKKQVLKRCSSLPTKSGNPAAQPLEHGDNTSGPEAPDVELLYLAAPYISHGLTPPPKGHEVFTMVSVGTME
jgi:hypothetical protein